MSDDTPKEVEAVYDDEEEAEAKSAKGKGKKKAKKDMKPHFLIHGPAKGGHKVVGTKETRAEVNATSPIVEQNYQWMKQILREEFGLSCTELRCHFVSCLIPCNTILTLSEFETHEDPIGATKSTAKNLRE